MTTLYADTSALLKRVIVEPESAAVRDVFSRSHAAGDLVAASGLAWVEVWRALRRAGITNVASTARRALSGVAEFPLSDDTLRRARTVGQDDLRSLDAVHLAAAIKLAADAVLTYDIRLAQSATAAGLTVLSPG